MRWDGSFTLTVNLAQVSECINKIVDSQLSQIELFCQDNNIIPRTMRIVLVGGGFRVGNTSTPVADSR